jgi:hypothetical protein
VTLHEALEIAGCAALAGLFGALFNELWLRLKGRRRRRHRGEHRPVWRRGPRTDPYTSTDVPLKGLHSQVDAPTEEIPKPGGGVAHSEGEQ